MDTETSANSSSPVNISEVSSEQSTATDLAHSPALYQEGQHYCGSSYEHLPGTLHDEARSPSEPSCSWLHNFGSAAFKRGEGLFGCSHYKRRCKLVAPCCNQAYWCRHCHNHATMEEEQDLSKQHELDRTKVTEVICALCNTQQPISEACNACGVGFGAYSCLKCSFFEDDTGKEQFHCTDCGICRLGGQDNFFHCEKCACCFHVRIKEKHVCVEKSMHSNCPVCFEFLFDSCVATSVLQCGHVIHSQCLEELTEARQTTCPICMRSYSDMTEVWKQYDIERERLQMPLEYANWTIKVFCNDCHVTSTDRFHIVGQKCGGCGSYNTRRDTVFQAPPTALPDTEPLLQSGLGGVTCSTSSAQPLQHDTALSLLQSAPDGVTCTAGAQLLQHEAALSSLQSGGDSIHCTTSAQPSQHDTLSSLQSGPGGVTCTARSQPSQHDTLSSLQSGPYGVTYNARSQLSQPDAVASLQSSPGGVNCTARPSPAAAAEHTTDDAAPEQAAHASETSTAAPAAASDQDRTLNNSGSTSC